MKNKKISIKKKTYRVLPVAVSFLLIFMLMFDMTAFTSFGSGETLTIKSSSDWDEFAESVTSGEEDYEGITVLLDSDIEISTMAGTHVNGSNFDFSGNPFKGTFDGQGHTITAAISGVRCTAPFPYAGDGAVFKNLKIDGSITGSGPHAAGLVGSTKGVVTFENIVVAADITSSHAAGFVGHSYVSAPVFKNCVFSGTLNASTQGCGFVGWGWTIGDYPGTVSFTNCAAVGRVEGNGNYNPLGYTIDDGYINVQVNNCVYNIARKGSGNTKYDSGSSDQYRQVSAGIRTGEPTVKNITENTVYYASFNDAYSNWPDDTTLVQFADINTSSTINALSGEHSLDLNGYGIKTTASASVFTVGSGATLNLEDSNTDATHKFDVPEGAGLASLNEASGNYTVNGGYITGGNNNGHGGGVFVAKNGIFNLYGGCIIGNQATAHGGGVGVSPPGDNTALFNMYGGSICYNTATWGGGVNVYAVAHVNEGCAIHHNSASNGGGGIELESGGKLYLNSSTVTNNVVLSQNGGMWKGGGVHVPNGTECHIQGNVQIKDNYQETYGTKQNNLFIRKEVPGKVILDGTLTSNASIGVGTNGTMPFTITSSYGTYHGTNDPADYFTSDNAVYDVFLNKDGEAEIGTAPHEHDDISFTKWTSTNSLPTTAGNYRLGADVTISSRWDVPSGTTNLCLNGHVIKRTNASGTTGSVIQVGSGVTLNLYDCGKKTRYYTVASPSENGAGLGTIVDESTYNAADENARGTFKGGYITGGQITGAQDNQHLIGGGVNVDKGSFTMNGGTIIGNKTCINSGGVKVKGAGASFVMNDGAILANYNDCYGGGISIGDNSGSRLCTVTINGGLIARNWSGRNAGAIHLDGYKHTLSITGGSIVNNYTKGYYDNGSTGRAGGGIFAEGADLRLSGSPVIKDNAHGDNVSNNIHYRSTSDKITLSDSLTSDADIGIYFKGLNPTSDQKMVIGAQKDDLRYLHYDIPSEGVFAYCDGSKDWVYENGEYIEMAGTHHTHSSGTIWACKTPVAEVIDSDTTKLYNSLDTAVNAWTVGSTLKLRTDVPTSSTITVPSGEHTFDLNGYGILMTGNDRVVTINQNASLELNDSNPDRIHYITLTDYRGTAVSDSGETSVSNGNGVIKVTGGYLTGGYRNDSGYHDKCGAGVFNWGTFVMNGGNIVGNTMLNNTGGAIRNSGFFTMNSGTIAFNKSTGNGGGVTTYVPGGSQGKMTMNGGVISDNICGKYGGGIQIAGPLELTGGSIVRNTASLGGSGIYYGGKGDLFKLSGNPIIKDNINDNLYLDTDATFTINDSLTEGADIHIMMNNPAVFTIGWKDNMGEAHPEKYFKVDDSVSGVRVIRKDGEAALTGGDDLGDLYITYKANGGEGTMDSQLATSTSAELNKNTFTRDGYDFIGWNTKEDGSGDSYEDGGSLTLKGDLTLYAQWEKVMAVKLEGKGTEDEPYLIQSAEDWDALSEYINNGGKKYNGKHYKLTNDISVTTVLGTRTNMSSDSEDNVFSGDFDGGNHTLNVNIENVPFAAPFAIAQDLTIKDLKVTGTVKSNDNHATGLIGASKGRSIYDDCSITIKNVTVSVDVSCNSHIAGIIGHAHKADITMENVVFDGSLNASSVQGGMIGWGGISGGVKFKSTYKDCLFLGTYNKNAAFYPVAFASGQGTATLLNDFYTNSLGSGGSPIAKDGDGEVKLLATTVEKDGKVKYFENIDIASDSSNWVEGSTLKLMADVSISSTITVPSGKHTLDLNGHGLKMTNSGSIFIVDSGTTLNLEDSNKDETHKFDVPEGAGLATLNESSGNYTVHGGYITGGHYTEYFGGSVFHVSGADAVVNMSGGTLIGNRGDEHGGAVYAEENGHVYITGGKIVYNECQYAGAACFIRSNGNMTITGGEISHNNSTTGGIGGINTDSAGWLYLSGDPLIADNSKDLRLEAKLTIIGELTYTKAICAEMYIDGKDSGVFTSGWSDVMGEADPSDYFTSDNSEYVIALKDGEARFQYPDIKGVSSEGYEGSYDGKAHSITVSAPEGTTIKYGTEKGSYTLTENPKYTDTGTYTVYYEVSKDKNTSVSGSADVKINKISANVTVKGNTTTVGYDGNAHSADGYEAKADTDLYDVDKDVKLIGRAEAVRTDAGTTDMGLSADSFENINTNFKDVTFDVTDGYVKINKVDAKITTAPKAKTGLVYNGSEQELIEAGEASGGTLYYAIGEDSKTAPDSDAYKASIPKAVKAGHYYIWYKVNGDSNHNDISPSSFKVTLSEKESVTITGTILDSNNSPVKDATVQLTQGNKVVDVIVSYTDGGYYFTAPAGTYNIVVKSKDVTVTDMVKLSETMTYDVIIPTTDTNSLLDVVGSDGDIVVGGLNKEAESVRKSDSISDDKDVTVKMTVASVSEDGTDGAKAISGSDQDRYLEYYDLSLEKTVDSVTETMSESQNVLEVVIPFSYTKKKELTVYDYDGLSVTTLTESDSGNAGTYHVDKENGLISVYLNRFSTIALGYSPYFQVKSEMSLGSYKGKVSVKLVKDSNGKTYELNDVSIDNISFKNIPKGTYSMTIKWKDGAENKLELPFTVKK